GGRTVARGAAPGRREPARPGGSRPALLGAGLPRLRGLPPAPREPLGEARRPVDRRLRPPSSGGRARSLPAGVPRRARGEDRRNRPEGDLRPPPVPGRRRSELPHAGPVGRVALGWRRTAYPAGHADRLEAARRALRPG